MIYLACAPIDELADQGYGLGAQDEAYIARLRNRARRRVSLAARALMVRLLHEVVPSDGAIKGWSLCALDEGQRELRHDDGTRLFVSLSHSAREVAVGLSRETPLGVDVEDEGRMRQPERLMRHVSSAAEVELLNLVAPEERDELATLMWCLKEANAKIEGGLARSGRDVEVLPDAGDVLRALTKCETALWSERRTHVGSPLRSRLALAARRHQPLVAIGCAPTAFPAEERD